MNEPPDDRQFAPATQRNREPILDVLLQVLPPTGTVLEISSGTGEHAVFFAPRLAPRRWLPSDSNSTARDSIAAWRNYCPAENLDAAIALDARDPTWTIAPDQQNSITAIVNINMIHIAPWSACLGLLSGASRLLPVGGILYLYGPFKQGGRHIAPSNAAFDQSLQAQNPEWGIRDLDAVMAIAQAQDLTILKIYEMPANNLSVVLRR